MKKNNLFFILLLSFLLCSCGKPSYPADTPKEPAVKNEKIVSVPSSDETDLKSDTKADETRKEDVSESNSIITPSAEEYFGPLSVIGNTLVNEDGIPVQLKGLSTHGLAWFPSYVNKELFTEFKENWNADIIRLAMYTEEYGGYCSGGDKNNLLKLIDDGVNYCTDLEMYVIIDWHILSDNNPATHKTEAIDFFSNVSKKYADHTNIIYEICNEPNGNTTWEDIKAYALEVIPVIRENSPGAIIIVGTPTWSQEVDKAAANPITEYDNIMYALHFYADTHKENLRNTLKKAADSGLPIFVTEYGICDASGAGKINKAEANKWMTLLNDYNISSCSWNISNKSETSAIFISSCNKTNGFTENDLSDSGKWVYNMLTGKDSYEATYIPDKSNDNTSKEQSSQVSGESNSSYSSVSGTVSIEITEANSWESEGKTFTQYNVLITNNNSFDIGSWNGDITFDSPIEFSQGWCGKFSVNGNVLTISNESYNGSIASGESINDIGIIIAK